MITHTKSSEKRPKPVALHTSRWHAQFQQKPTGTAAKLDEQVGQNVLSVARWSRSRQHKITTNNLSLPLSQVRSLSRSLSFALLRSLSFALLRSLSRKMFICISHGAWLPHVDDPVNANSKSSLQQRSDETRANLMLNMISLYKYSFAFPHFFIFY